MRWHRYLDQLPHGVHSFPDYTAKAAMPRMIYDAYGKCALDPALPEQVLELAANPPPVSVYIPEVHMRLLLLGIQDSLGLDDERFVQDALVISRKFLSSVLWKTLFWLVTPERVFKNAESRWGAFHRGITMEVPFIGKNAATAIMRAPAALDTVTMARCNVMAIQAALEAAGGKDVRMICSIVSEGVTELSARWG